MIIFALTIDDATDLGGPMGSESTETLAVEFFETMESAKEYASEYFGGPVEWDFDPYDNSESADTGPYLFTIESRETK